MVTKILIFTYKFIFLTLDCDKICNIVNYRKNIIKIKINRSALENKDKKAIINDILEKTGAKLVDFVGFNAVLCKKPYLLGKKE